MHKDVRFVFTMIIGTVFWAAASPPVLAGG